MTQFNHRKEPDLKKIRTQIRQAAAYIGQSGIILQQVAAQTSGQSQAQRLERISFALLSLCGPLDTISRRRTSDEVKP